MILADQKFETNPIRARLKYCKEPNADQTENLKAFLTDKYGSLSELTFFKDENYKDGFVIEICKRAGDFVAEEIIDWSPAGKGRQLKEKIFAAIKNQDKVIPLIKETALGFKPLAVSEEIGNVLTVGDGIATVSGLENVKYGEILVFEHGIKGMVLDLKEDRVGCVIFGDEEEITEGSLVKRSFKTAGVSVGNKMLGRIVDALGTPIDGKGPISFDGYYPIEKKAPGIIDRQPVNKPLETGLLAIDSMFPIGRGQRELIIGDRQTGKTAIALDTILNQKDKDVICVYVAIGQKASSVAQLAEVLKSKGAMDYTVIVNACASDSAPLQYIAPYSGCAIAEYFMESGRDVLIVYDDLSKHAIAYRTLSLLLERSPGREAYPGDVFYLHSRLLERSAHLSDALGGGSMTALPIVETQAGDVSAYIPTNIISITDGQIFLESDLFFAGQRPAVNVGLSVSRVGGAAQTRAMKKATGAIRLDLAQYREMEVFMQFSSDLDETTKRQLHYGEDLMQLLKQKQYHPYKEHQQVILLVSALSKAFSDVPVKEVPQYSEKLIAFFESTEKELCEKIDATGEISDEEMKLIADSAGKFLKKS